MRANKTQEWLCDAIKENVDWWKSSNDITSPTHMCDMEESLFSRLENVLTDDEREELNEKLQDLYWFIRKYDNRNNEYY